MTESGSISLVSSGSGIDGASRPQPPRPPRYAQCGMPVFLVFLAFVVVRYVQAGERMDLLRTIRFEFLLGGISIILAIVQMSGRKPRIGTSRALLISICLLFFCLIIQLPFAADPVIARRIFNDRAFKFAMLAFLIVAFVESPTYMKLFLGAFLFSIFYITTGIGRGTGLFRSMDIPTAWGAWHWGPCRTWSICGMRSNPGTCAWGCLRRPRRP
ncbi:MAG: hypothetical protein IPH86_12285 [bacterium]|nr:hypothetical protein [bacterium]